MSAVKRIAHILGYVIIVLVILISIPFSIPKLFGYQEFEIITGSMEPDYPVASLIYVDSSSYEDTSVGDVISFYSPNDSSSVVTHRIYDYDYDSECFITKGDANEEVDVTPVPFVNMIGRVVLCIPHAGFVSRIIDSMLGRIALIGLIILSVILIIFTEDKEAPAKKVSDKNLSSKKKRIINALGFIVGGVLILVALINIIGRLLDYNSSNEQYSKLEETYLKQDEAEDSDQWYNDVRVDLQALQEEYPDIIGWIYFENEDISYPVLYSGDDSTYLRTTYEGVSATAGSIFLEGKNNPDFEDCHSIIYGHNMHNLSMFGKLKYYNRDESYYDNHQYFQIFYGNYVYRYEIFAYETVDQQSFVYNVAFENDDSFQEFIDEIYSISEKDTGVSASKEDKIISLSTCSTSKDTNRFVVNAKRVDSYEIN